MSRTVGKRAACIKSACVSVASPRGKTNRCLKSARIPGQLMNPTSQLRGETNTQMIANISQSSLLQGKPNTPVNQSGCLDETQIVANNAQFQGAQNSVNLSNSLQTCANLANGMQIESYRRLASKPERPPRAIDKIIRTLSLSNQNSINLANSQQICADLANGRQIESYRRLDPTPGTPSRGSNTNNEPKARGAFAVAPHPDADDYYQDCLWESMIYSRAYKAGIYTRDRVISSYKPKVISRAIRKAKRFLRKKSEPRTEANLKVVPLPLPEERTKTKSMSFLERTSVKEAVEYEIERAELNAKLSLSMHTQLETRAFKYHSIPNDQEVVTGYPETIAPLVMDSSHLRCATRANTDKMVTSSPETLNATYEDE